MKKIIVEIALTLGCCAWAQAAWVGKLDLSPAAQPIVLREAHDGQWLAGISHPNIWRLEHNGNTIVHAGVFQAWNSEHGNASVGPIAGLDLMGCSKEVGINIPQMVSDFGNWVGVPTLFKPAYLFTSMMTLDFFAGYRPFHSPDVIGNFVYGGAAGLSIPFGVKELQNGNMNTAG